MPYSLNEFSYGLVWTMSGVVTVDDFKEINQIIYNHPRFTDLRYLIFDYTDAEDFRMESLEVKKIAAVDNAAAMTNARIQIGVVSANQALLDAIALYSSYNGGHPWRTELFDTSEDALNWRRRLVVARHPFATETELA